MKKRQHIFILGNSLILGALGESLRRSGQFDLTRLDLPKEVRGLEPMKPDAILFDLETPHMESIFSLSESYSKLLLVGISPDTNIVKVWVGRQLQELSMQGLLAVIKDQLNVSLFEGGSAG
ncbi:MAG: hypothetical protein SCM11_03270 [Bacillota bacterium]|nr:hypothetical protein [Bacillota bacterium]